MKRQIISPTINGMIALVIFIIGIPVIEEATNKLEATGGVTKAIDKAMIITIPK